MQEQLITKLYRVPSFLFFFGAGHQDGVRCMENLQNAYEA